MDGTSTPLQVLEDSTVHDTKVACGKARGIASWTLELFKKDTEDALPNAARLSSLGVTDGGKLFGVLRKGTPS
jgi:hypothetical protein